MSHDMPSTVKSGGGEYIQHFSAEVLCYAHTCEPTTPNTRRPFVAKVVAILQETSYPRPGEAALPLQLLNQLQQYARYDCHCCNLRSMFRLQAVCCFLLESF